MKETLKDQTAIEKFKEKISSWINEHKVGEFISNKEDINIVELFETSLYRYTYIVQVESREINGFSRPNDSEQEFHSNITSQNQIDPWKVESGISNEFVEQHKVQDIQESLSSDTCGECNGQGKINCFVCQGNKTIVCNECNGKGEVICSTCKGDRYIPCDNCKNMGMVYDEKEKTYVVCPKCNGQRQFLCKDCKEGYQICKKCNDNKHLPCENCNQTGIVQCAKCKGTGRIISGFTIKIETKPAKEQIEIKNTDIPENIISKMMPFLGEWSLYKSIKNGSITKDNLVKQNLPNGIVENIEQLKSKIKTPENCRITNSQLNLDKKYCYYVVYKYKGNKNKIWLVGPDSKVFTEHTALPDVYLDIINTIDLKIQNDELAEAKKLFNQIKNIKMLETEIKKIKEKLFKKLSFSYFLGSLAGAVVFWGIMLPILYKWRGTSFHLNFLIITTLFANIFFTFLTTAILYIINFKFAVNFKKRLITGLAGSIILLLLVYSASAMFYIDPARKLDEKNMIAEYNKHFPFGLRSLANKEDIEFLQNLIKKYEPTGVDLKSVKKDLAWLKAKRKKDIEDLKKAEKIRKRIMDAGASKKKKKPRRRRESRIKITY